VKSALHRPAGQTGCRLFVVALLAVVSACSSTDRGDTISRPPADILFLRGAGATFPSVLYNQWFAIYHREHPRTAIIYDTVGSGEGVERFIGQGVEEEKQVDFGASDAAMTDQEISKVHEGVVMLPATAGSVVLVYNLPDFTGDLKLSREAYVDIFRGEIRNWNDRRIAATNPGAKLPNLTIAPVVRLDSSGTTYAFSKHLDAISEAWHRTYGTATVIDWPGNAMRARGNEGVAARVGNSIGAIGYVGYEFARKLGLKMAVLQNRQGNFIKPNPASGTAALGAAQFPENLRAFVPDPSGTDAYPIVTFSWILLRKNYEDPEKGNAVRDLFQWCLGDGQEYAAELGYIPLTQDVMARSLAALSTVTSIKQASGAAQ
jgi:phosphate transport system substrate-binding protein